MISGCHRFRAALSCAAAATLLPGCAAIPASGVVTESDLPIAYVVSGKGAPTVVFQSGLGDGKATWGPVMRKLDDSRHVFAYDRPGYGGSAATGVPRDPCAIAREAHDTLRDAHVPGPYVLVGHSLGGLYQYAFARMYPDDVAGLVLLDPTHPDHWAAVQRDAPAAAATLKALRATVFTPTERHEFDQQSACLDQLDARPLLHAPTRILASTDRPALEKGDFEQVLKRLREDWLRLTGASQIEAVARSGHYIQTDRPEAVVAAINAVVAQGMRSD